MPNFSVSDIRAKLLLNLQEVTGLKQVSVARTFETAGYPYCIVYLSQVENELLTNQPEYKRVYTFTIEIRQETSQATKTNAEAWLEDVIDAVLDKLGTEWQLDNKADHSLVQGGTINEVDGTQGTILQATILFSVWTFVR